MGTKIGLLAIFITTCNVLAFGQSETWFAKGLRTKDPVKQVGYLTKSLETEGITAEKYVLRGDAYFKLGLHAVYQHGVIMITFGKGEWHNSQTMYDHAISDYTQALKLDPKCYQAYMKRGDVYWQRGRNDLKLADLNTLISLDSANAKAWRERGWLYLNNFHDVDRSISDLTTAIALDPGDTLAYLNRGYNYSITMQCERALADYEMAILIAPGKPWGYTGRGEVYMSMFENDKALGDFCKAIELNKKDMRAHSGRGYIWLLKGQYKEALKDFNKVIAIAPSWAYPYGNKGYALLQEGKLDEAITYLEKFTELDKQAFTGHLNLAIAYYLKGNMEQVKEHFILARSLNPFLSQGFDEILRLEADGRARQSASGYYWTPRDKEILVKIFEEYK